MSRKLPANVNDYRQEAQNIRALARGINDAEAKAQLLLIASIYDKLADRLTALARSPDSTLSGNSGAPDAPEETDPL